MLNTVIINNVEYVIIDTIQLDNNSYVMLVNTNDENDFFIRKIIIKDGKEYFSALAGREEFEKLLVKFTERLMDN